MIHSTIEVSRDDHRLAKLAALAIGLTLIDQAIPSPVPGVKPGLANIVTLLVFYRFGWRDCAWVSVLRIVAASLISGTFLSPTFVMSFAGGVASLATLALLVPLARTVLGPVGVSVICAFAHMAAQLLVAFVWLVPHAGLLGLAPVLFGAALVFGVVNGVIAARLLLPDSSALKAQTA